MKERVKFILEWERRRAEAEGEQVNVAELCRVHGVSRDTGHRWIRRYRDAGHKLDAMQERSRRPRSSPSAVSEELQDLVAQARKAQPRRGPRKLRAWLMDKYPDRPWPSASTISAILGRRGLTAPRPKRRRKSGPIAGVVAPFADCDAPNAVWCIDFKGKFRTADRQWCHVLTIVDAYSRFLIRCELVLEPDGERVERICDSAFLEYGLPVAMRSDNGPPFASNAPVGLTTVSVWWLRLGLRLERIQPGKPQQNGRQERLHRTLEEVVATPAATPAAQQRAIDRWRADYNHDRPHESLGQKPPVHVYTLSPRRYPRPLRRCDPPPWRHSCKVDRAGFIRWGRHKLFVTSALAHETVEAELLGDRWQLYYFDILLGDFREGRLGEGLRLARRERNAAGLHVLTLDRA